MIRFREALAVFIAAGAAWGQTAAVPARPRGYLSQAETASVLRIVPPAPATGDPRFETDMAIFRATRSLEGSARWALARSDDNLSVGSLLKAFACAMKLNLTAENAPKLAALLTRANSDAGSAANVIKIHYQHKRPFQVAEGDVCLSPLGKANLERSPDYPSGHTAISWDAGLILAELSPHEAAEILARARAFGQSRVVCGVHNLSAVESGWMTGTAVFAMQENSGEFRKDLEAAKAEIAALRAEKDVQPAGCEAEAKTLAASPY
jgi:acid phosphatase (class A)